MLHDHATGVEPGASEHQPCVLVRPGGSPGIYVIESGDLHGWSPLGTVANVSGAVLYAYTNAVDAIRLFRARMQ